MIVRLGLVGPKVELNCADRKGNRFIFLYLIHRYRGNATIKHRRIGKSGVELSLYLTEMRLRSYRNGEK